MPLKIVHAADLHIGAAHTLLGKNAARRSAEILNSLHAVAELCRDTGAEVLLLAGDLFDSPCPEKSDVDTVKAYLAALAAEVFIVPGNHDYLTPSSPYMEDWSENVHIFREEGVAELENARIYGIPFCSPFMKERALPKAERDGKINILLMHGDIFGGEYNPLTELKIAATDMDYVALGHVHAPSEIKQAGRVYFAYPGSVEPLGFDETGAHGAIAGTVYKGDAALSLVPLCRRTFREIELSVSGYSSDSELLAALTEQLKNFTEDMVKIILTGDSSFSPDIELIKTTFEGRVFSLRVKDRTYPKENLELLRTEQTLKGIFADRALAYTEALSGEKRVAALKALEIGLSAFRGREVDFRED